MIRRFLPSLALAFALAAPAAAQEKPFSTQQEDAVRRIVRDYLLKHPDVIAEAIQILQQRQKADADDKRRMMLEMRRGELTGTEGGNPVLGNPKGDVVIAEFFDYRCGYCKQVAPHVMKLLESDRNVKLVLIELPILGKDSVFATRASLASMKQGKYLPYHNAMMGHRGQLDEATVLRVARESGLDVERLKRDMADPGVEATIRRNMDLAEALDLNGTPAFVIGDEVVPGAIGPEALRELVKKARGGG